MTGMATITSKRQFTIPVDLFRKLGFQEGERVFVKEENGALKIESALVALERLGGSVKVPKRFQGMDIDQMIEKAKEEYFSKKYKKSRE